MRDINLKATEYFEAVARLGTVTKAAKELTVSPSAVSQQIRVLEGQLGTKLFRREKQRLVLTLEGDRLYQTTSHAFRAIRNARDSIGRQRDVRGITIRASPSFGVRWLGPNIADFTRQNDDWRIRIDATPEFSSFETEAIDCDLRYGLGGWAGLTVECILNDFQLPLCSPGYLEKWQDDATAAERLAGSNLIDSVKTLYRWDFWLASNQLDIPDLAYAYCFDRSSMSIEMAKQGGGVALDSAVLCLGELERGELVPFLPQATTIEFPAYWFVCPSRHLNRRIVKRFYNWLQDRTQAQEDKVRTLLKNHGCDIQMVSVAQSGLSV